MNLRALRVPIGALVLVGFFAVGGWLDYRATSRELRALRESEADTLYETIAAAARVQHSAAQSAETALGHRLLDQARLLSAFDKAEPLDERTVVSLVPVSAPYRVVVFDASGRRELVAGEGPQGPGGGRRGLGLRPRDGSGAGAGPPAGASRVAQRLLSGETHELVAEPHAARGGGERLAAGVRRANGGAIIVNAANQLASELDSVYSLDALVSQIANATPALAYILLDDEGNLVARGSLASPASRLPMERSGGSRTTIVGDVPVFERSGTLALDETRRTLLRIGMRLDDVQRAERRALLRIGWGLSALAAVLVLGIAFGGLRQRYGRLSERHAHAQEALRRRDRLAAMGEMASTVAHEIRNPLNAIAMSAQRLAREYPRGDAEEAAELVEVIQREAARLNGRVQQFQEFARPRPVNPREIDLRKLLAEAAAAASPLAGTQAVGIEIQSGGFPTLTADADQLREALDNLLRNAIDATPAGGTITVLSERRGRNVVIVVKDTGAGIPADVLPRVFDLYFTTKREGTGVGLAVVQQIAIAHGGRVSAESQLGSGTTIMLELPQHGVPRG